MDIVAPALLTPPDLAICGGWRLDAALVLDRELTALAGMDAHCRFVQARIARRLIESRAWRRLGFARLSDYARERLGVAPRTLEADSHVVTALDSLPLLRAALVDGRLSWTAIRLLVRVATAHEETLLIEKACLMTTRELESFVANAAQGMPDRAEGAIAVAAACTGDDPGDVCHGDDTEMRWSMDVSRTGRRLWRAAGELASRTAGSPLSGGQVLECVVAEALGEIPAPAADGSRRWIPSADDLVTRFRERARVDQLRGEAAIRGFLAEVGVVDGFTWLDSPRRGAGPAACLDDLARDLDRADAFELDSRLRTLRLAVQRVDSQIAALLRIGIDRRLFRELGFATVKIYVESRLGFSSRKAWSLVAIERVSWRVRREFRDAWRDGQISHLAAAVLLPVINDVHVASWIERARTVTLRRLVDEVAWSLDRADAEGAFATPAPPSADADVRIDGASGVDRDEVRARAHGEPDGHHLAPRGAVRVQVGVPISVAALVEIALFLHRRGSEPRWRTFERIVAMAILEWTRVPRHRDPIFERDGWRCTVPGCSSRRNLHDHHVLYRSHGGGNRRDNRTTVCAAHHLHGIHAGIVRARGKAPGDIVWELGCQPGRAPLMRLSGDSVIYASS